jgi:hypothetical protein
VTREQAPRPGQRQRLEVLKTVAEQDETVEGLAEAELADLDTQPADPVEDDATNSTVGTNSTGVPAPIAKKLTRPKPQ